MTAMISFQKEFSRYFFSKLVLGMVEEQQRRWRTPEDSFCICGYSVCSSVEPWVDYIRPVYVFYINVTFYSCVFPALPKLA